MDNWPVLSLNQGFRNLLWLAFYDGTKLQALINDYNYFQLSDAPQWLVIP